MPKYYHVQMTCTARCLMTEVAHEAYVLCLFFQRDMIFFSKLRDHYFCLLSLRHCCFTNSCRKPADNLCYFSISFFLVQRVAA